MLHLAGNYAVAAYGVISNIAIVTIAIANGVALGAQPLISREVGDHRFTAGKQILNHAFKITISLALLLTLILVLFKGPIIGIFNAEHQAQLVKYATVGLPIYFTSAVFTAINLMAIIFLTAIGSSRFAFVLSFFTGLLDPHPNDHWPWGRPRHYRGVGGRADNRILSDHARPAFDQGPLKRMGTLK